MESKTAELIERETRIWLPEIEVNQNGLIMVKEHKHSVINKFSGSKVQKEWLKFKSMVSYTWNLLGE